MTNNLPSGYFRDFQLLKEIFVPAFSELLDCITIAGFAIEQMTVKTNLLDDERYQYVFSVEDVNRLVMQGVPFRDAYREVGKQINEGNYQPTREIHHMHEGSIGNLCIDEIATKMVLVIESFEFQIMENALVDLLKPVD
jgi:argininosuccinate lyase